MDLIDPLTLLMNYLVWLLLGLSTSVSLAQPIVRIDSLPPQGLLLNKGWTWHSGDNPVWAKADVDDSKWENIDPTKDIHDLPQVRRAQIGWFRLKLQVDSTLLQQALALVVRQVGASEIYVDGRLIYQLGVVSTVPEQEQTTYLKGEVYSFHLSGQPTHQLAVRYSFTKANFYHNIDGFGNPCLALYIENSNQGHSNVLYNNLINFVLEFALTTLHLLLGVTFLFFYFSFNTHKPYLFFGLFALGTFTAHIFFTLRIRPKSASFDALYYYVGYVITNISLLFLLVGIYAFYARPKGPLFYGLVGYAILTLPGMLLFYNDVWMLNSGLYLIFNLDTLRQYWYAMKSHQAGAGARTLFVTNLVFFVFFLPSLALRLASLGGWAYISISIGLFATPIGYSLFLAGEFARTAHILRKRVVEVEELSAEKQQILSAQNETLERQVAERTTELHQSLTDLKATQTQLIQKEKLASLGELTAGIAHEIQNPLNFVNNFSEVSAELVSELKDELTKGDTDEAKAIADDLAQNLQKITHHGSRVSAIVKGMLEHSRTVTGERQLTELNALADEYLRLAYQGLKAKDKGLNWDLVTDFASDLGPIEVVPQEIGRVLLNLYTNAFYALQQKLKTAPIEYHPTVWVSTHHLANAVEMRIKDNGTGIPESVKSKIFQPFFTTKPTGEGTGLGLSLSYDIVTKGHGGRLSVESVEGDGSEFVITLPTT
ncbi:ATP-binding protein [Spirosoma luteum]|uniref:ATP-binding protein n=1 Tax=Spirosoma luteum TaxID=431553 RepID=UPI0003686867|nr:ATP-binding protein [Spirosoma luteum]